MVRTDLSAGSVIQGSEGLSDPNDITAAWVTSISRRGQSQHLPLVKAVDGLFKGVEFIN
jgi:hypothetical protein